LRFAIPDRRRKSRTGNKNSQPAGSTHAPFPQFANEQRRGERQHDGAHQWAIRKKLSEARGPRDPGTLPPASHPIPTRPRIDMNDVAVRVAADAALRLHQRM
jgi:hypothetical protein